MKLTYHLSEREYLEGLTLHLKQSKGWRKPVAIFYAVALSVLALFLWLASRVSDSGFLYLGCWLVVAVLLLRSLTAKDHAQALLRTTKKRRDFATSGIIGNRILEAGESGVSITLGGQPRRLAWASLVEVREDSGFLLLLTAEETLYDIVPPSAFPSQEIRSEILEYLRQCMTSAPSAAMLQPGDDAEMVFTCPPWTEEELTKAMIRWNWYVMRWPLVLGLLSAACLPLSLYAVAHPLPGDTANAAVFLVGTLLTRAMALFGLLGILILSMCLILLVFWVPRQCRKRGSGSQMSSWCTGTQRVEFTAQGIRGCRAGNTSFTHWSQFKRIRREKDCLLLVLRHFQVYPIPMSAFSSPAHMEEAIAYLAAKKRTGS